MKPDERFYKLEAIAKRMRVPLGNVYSGVFGEFNQIVEGMQSMGCPFALESAGPKDWRASFEFETGRWQTGETKEDAVIRAAYELLLNDPYLIPQQELED